MSHPAHVALVGCGFTGTSAFFQLVDRFPVRRITVFEASGNFGPGFPYQQDECRHYLLNNTTDTMCLTPSHRRAFADWLHSRPETRDLATREHLPRSLYGEFLADVFRSTLTCAALKGIDVETVPAEATGLREDDAGRVHVAWDGGEVATDAAILATGRCPDIDPYPHPPPGSTARYLPSHVMRRELDDLPLDATIHVLGASLSAYDVVNRLFAPETGCRFVRDPAGELAYEPGPNARRAVLYSRSGRLKAMQSRARPAAERTKLTGPALSEAALPDGLRLERVAELIRAEADARGATVDWGRVAAPYADCRTTAEVDARAGSLLEAAIRAGAGAEDNLLVDLFDDAQGELWDAFAERLMPVEEEMRYRRDYESGVLSYLAACPIETGERLLALLRAGRLAVRTGAGAVRFDDGEDRYAIEHAFGVEHAAVVVNATGRVDRRVTSERQPSLVRDLVDRGLLAPYARDGRLLEGADVDMTTFRAHGARSIYVANMLLWGPGFFTSSALTMARVVERLLEGLYPPLDGAGPGSR